MEGCKILDPLLCGSRAENGYKGNGGCVSNGDSLVQYFMVFPIVYGHPIHTHKHTQGHSGTKSKSISTGLQKLKLILACNALPVVFQFGWQPSLLQGYPPP